MLDQEYLQGQEIRISLRGYLEPLKLQEEFRPYLRILENDQLLTGKQFFKEEFGKDNEILWLPDVFGYSAALPKIMKECGIRYFMTTKISWNDTNKMPYDTFFWKGIDGTKILTHFVTTRDYSSAS